MGNEKGTNDRANSIPEQITGPERTLQQMFQIFVDPEVKRRQLSGSLPDPFTVVQAQVLFFEGRSPEVRLNDEVKISLIVKAPRAVQKGEPISLSEIEHFETSELDLLTPMPGILLRFCTTTSG